MKVKKIFIILMISIVFITGLQSISYADSVDPHEITRRANDWIETGESNQKIKSEAVTTPMQEIAGLLWGIGVFLAVAVGMILGIKFMLSTPTGKAEISQLLTPYIVGVAIVVGALTIWRLVVTMLDV